MIDTYKDERKINYKMEKVIFYFQCFSIFTNFQYFTTFLKIKY